MARTKRDDTSLPLCLWAFAALLAVAGCDLPGRPTPADVVQRPTDILDPVVLYKQNCAGCHGADGKLGPAPPIGDPVYLAIVDDNTLRSTISKGRPGTAMSAFAQSEGGMLTFNRLTLLFRECGSAGATQMSYRVGLHRLTQPRSRVIRSTVRQLLRHSALRATA